MKSITILLFSIILFAGCADICSDIQTNYDNCRIELIATKSKLDTLTIENQSLADNLNKAIHKTDSLQLQNAAIYSTLQNCNSAFNSSQAVVTEKQNQIQLLTNQLQQITNSYNTIFGEYNQLLSENYIVSKAKVNNTLDKANEDILEAEAAYNQIKTIDPIPEHALKETAKNLNFNCGIRYNIGLLFPEIQVQSCQIDTAKD